MEQSGSESVLLARLASDLRSYFAQLVFAYQERLYAFARRLCGSAHDAEDIVQEAFVGAYVSLENYTPERIRTLKLQSWLYRITLNTYYHHIRSAHLHLVPLDSSEEGMEQVFENSEDERPEALFEVKERQEELEALVATLPERYRVAIACYFFEQLTYQEMADLFEQPVGTVKSTVSRGVRLLRTQLVQFGEKGKGYSVWNTSSTQKNRKSSNQKA